MKKILVSRNTLLSNSKVLFAAAIGVGPPTGTVLFEGSTRSVFITLRTNLDRVGQEETEVFELPLSIISVNLPAPVFVTEPAVITVIDSSGGHFIC